MATEEPRGREAVRKQPDARPEPVDETSDERDSRTPLLEIPVGNRYTTSVDRLVAEAELACDGVELGNPAKIPADADHVAEAFAERIEDTDLVPAWTRPWEVDDDA